MKWQKERITISIVVLALLIFAGCWQGCAALNVNLTPQARYLEALKWYDDNLETYLTFYRTASPTVQERLKRDVDPLFKGADEALDIWQAAIGSGQAGASEDAWMSAKKLLLTSLTKFGVIVIKEE